MIKEVAIIYYKDSEGQIQTKAVDLPLECLGRHDLTCDFIDSVMGGNDRWESYDIQD